MGNQMKGMLIGIARVRTRGGPVEEVKKVDVTPSMGIVGDARGAIEDRQVTVLFREGWESACRDLHVDLSWILRRANLYVDGIKGPCSIGGRLRIGSVVLLVTQETDPCNLMERAFPGLRKALTPEWRGGICCSVISGGPLITGDTVESFF